MSEGAMSEGAMSAEDVLWDFAGADGLQAAIALFTPAISHTAPFQSLSATFNRRPCSVLRLCENNFRVALSEQLAFDEAIAALNLKVWSKPCPAVNLIVPTELGLKRLPEIATTKPLYTLTPFPCDRAVPAHIDAITVLAWHHLWQEQPRLTIQTAAANANKIRQAFSIAE
ncbi:hypothetical protein [cf. Phormidesmis sp. LEGE 11477]|uniref:hypothetical protein n=1 Tax=cf. Phormidesmis sp. LEGE 11477 TaxID=1828680 RepID=UPI00187FB41B|nr:hypothetical protein [cf. Phormidesmis sp. LEGE 11477]MBE9065033.1 hypothetical protein [cf. Phormidesmis sp. LEGE 11477]